MRNPTETLTPELRRALDAAGDSPIRLKNPETDQTYVLLAAEVDEKLLEEQDQREQSAFLKAAKQNAKARLAEDS